MIILVEWMSLCIISSTPLIGGLIDINWLPL